MSSLGNRGGRTNNRNARSRVVRNNRQRHPSELSRRDQFNRRIRQSPPRHRSPERDARNSRDRYSPDYHSSPRHRSRSPEVYHKERMSPRSDYYRGSSPDVIPIQPPSPQPLLGLHITQPNMDNYPADYNSDYHNMPSSSNQAVTTTTIPEFNPDATGMNVHEWMDIFSEVAADNNWTLDDKKFHFANKLGGSARRWFINSKMMDEKWGTIKSAFKKSFPSDAHFYEQLSTMMNRVKQDNESMSNYFYHKIALINECEFTGIKAVSCLIGGLKNSKLKSFALKQQFQTPEDLYTFLCKSEEQTDEKRQSDKVCTICNMRNHTADNCKEKSSNSKKDRTILNVQGDMYNEVLVNKYVVDVLVNGTKTIGYVSMTSNFVTVREEDAWLLKMNYESCNKMLKYFGKNSIKAIGIGKIHIQIDDAILDMDAYVVNNTKQMIPLVIGRSFSLHDNVKYISDDVGLRFSNVEEHGHANMNVPQHKHWLSHVPRTTTSSYRK